MNRTKRIGLVVCSIGAAAWMLGTVAMAQQKSDTRSKSRARTTVQRDRGHAEAAGQPRSSKQKIHKTVPDARLLTNKKSSASVSASAPEISELRQQFDKRFSRQDSGRNALPATPGGACPGDGPCCTANGTPGCEDAGCCDAVCAFDSFCCDTSWDAICASEAGTEPACSGVSNCPGAAVCGNNIQEAGEQCDGTDDANCPGMCQADCSCPAPMVCGEGSGACCAPNGTPGCEDAGCCDAVCAIDSFCCDTEWDGICAGEAAAEPACADAPGCGPVDVTCDVDKIDENEPDCGLPADTTNGGCNSAPVVTSPIACGESYCGTGAFDGATRDTDWYEFTLAGPGNTLAEWCVTAGFPHALAIIDNLCPPAVLSPFLTGGAGQEVCVTAVLAPGTYRLFTAHDFVGGTPCTAMVQYNASLTCTDLGDPVCGNNITEPGEECDGTDDANCNGLGCNPDCTCISPCDSTTAGSCCDPAGNGTPGCSDDSNGPNPACCSAVCALDPFCCDVAWDGICASEAAADPNCTCIFECGNGILEPGEQCDPPNGTTCDENCQFIINCDSTAIVAPAMVSGNSCGSNNCPLNAGDEDIYEVTLPNDGIWCFSTCNQAAYDTWIDIGTTCCGTDIASVDDTSGCGGFTTEVCTILPAGVVYVMVEGFGMGCGDYTLTIAKSECGNGVVEPGEECDPPDGVGCDANCQIITCGPQAGSCCEANGTPGCGTDAGGDAADCCEAVCAADPFCCDVAWDSICAEEAGSTPPCECGFECGNGILEPGEECDPPDGVSCDDNCQIIICGPNAGPCEQPNGSPGCDNVACCELVCAIDPFCCDVTWDSICADEAIANCTFNACCDHSLPGGACFSVGDCTECAGEFQECFPDADCADIEAQGLCEEITGACCELGVSCTENVPQSECGSAAREYSVTSGAAIPDLNAAGVSVILNVPDSGTIADLNVSLNITHTWVGDLCATLTHPSGAPSVQIIQRSGDDLPCDATGCCGCGSDNYFIVLDDQGTGGNIEGICDPGPAAASPPNYEPFNPLVSFNGLEKQGDWTLTISDNAGLDTGTIDSWGLQIVNAGDQGEFAFFPNTPCSEADCQLCGNGVVDPGEDCDGGECCDPNTCTYLTTVCRQAAGPCDATESCSGSSADCPPDAKVPAGTVCNPGDGACVLDAECDGSSDGCPANEVVTACSGSVIDNCCPMGCNATNDADCMPICGNSRVEQGEQCDDGNLEPGDGCDEFCQLEPPAVPTVTHWGMIAMILVLLAAIGAKFGRRRMTAN